MGIPNNFSEYYKTLADSELLAILENFDDYLPEAVEGARKELSSRQLTETQIQKARELLIAKQQQKEKQKEYAEAVEEKIRSAGNSFIDTINPIQKEIPTTERTIRLIVIVFGGIFIYQLLKDYKMHVAFVEDIPRFPLSSTIYLLPLVLLPFGTFFFWKRKPIGWLLLTIYLTFSASSSIFLLAKSIIMKSSDSSLLEDLFPTPPPGNYLIPTLFYVGSILVLSKQNIRNVFLINDQKMGITIIVTGIISFALLLLLSKGNLI